MAQKIVEGSQRLVGMKRGFSRIEAATFVGISPTKFDELVKDGRMPRAKQVDGRKVWDLCELNLRSTNWEIATQVGMTLDEGKEIPKGSF